MRFFTDWTGHRKALGMFVALAVHAAACDDVETATDADDAVAAGEDEGEVTFRPLVLESRTCNGGWPGTRWCSWTLFSETDIVPGSIQVQINGHNGEVTHSASQIGSRQINFVAVVHEGDVFNPGKNTTSYTVAWLRV